ncbi:ATP-NAD kinase-like domain-containing protein [Lentinula raphanica]|uniref:ATP-NAD kinase-like domain-containing protein n=1 Tax=Lentinula raphanica TaxID=153919 RepID=A0AA38UBW7_9AGAR|nr:ATP-NAD kinase-like domain-containing protein [Lentinula raphanica]KAJ3755525.1 ATP-NAD kinase-like domain-containing protein [Lentinula raphanica]KAJ3829038.1 ATP-NAD kinase-like domain-containing protein [Lentinula raphanica]KAJ3836669.1 ATP-NAD kinase-like domain-containing protein [Lentinula raphanica]KAJ3970646.1 ATP-NAD kinase-like domain-containing protein [Lentinula raphanica]
MTDIDTEAKVYGKNTKYCLTSTTLTVTIGNKKPERIPLYNIIAASYHPSDSQLLKVAYVTRQKKKGPLKLVQLDGQVEGDKAESAGNLAKTTLEWAYKDIKPNRRLKILVNPHGGVGKGVAIFNKHIEPVFRAAGCSLDIVHTRKTGDAYDIAKTLPLIEYDALITVSGDGLVHEVLNGFANHVNPRRALRMPIAPIPTGSGNGLSLNLLGLEDGLDVVAATLNIIKGSPMPVDVFSFTQNGKRTISFMSQALGLMADVDLGTEDLRWMGDSRFMYGLFRGLIKFKPCDVQLSYKAVEQDKRKMFENLNLRLSKRSDYTPEDLDDDTTLPEPKVGSNETEGWTTFSEPLLYMYAGKGPYVARTFMAFPVSLPDDGLIDIAVQSTKNFSRTGVLSSFDGAPKGEIYWNDSLHYIKAEAYRVKPLSKKGYLSIDGESYPFEEFQVEVLPRLATLLSSHGHYKAPFDDTKARSK